MFDSVGERLNIQKRISSLNATVSLIEIPQEQFVSLPPPPLLLSSTSPSSSSSSVGFRVECRARNSIGMQTKPCSYSYIAKDFATKPFDGQLDDEDGCAVSWNEELESSEQLIVTCASASENLIPDVFFVVRLQDGTSCQYVIWPTLGRYHYFTVFSLPFKSVQDLSMEIFLTITVATGIQARETPEKITS